MSLDKLNDELKKLDQKHEAEKKTVINKWVKDNFKAHKVGTKVKGHWGSTGEIISVQISHTDLLNHVLDPHYFYTCVALRKSDNMPYKNGERVHLKHGSITHILNKTGKWEAIACEN